MNNSTKERGEKKQNNKEIEKKSNLFSRKQEKTQKVIHGTKKRKKVWRKSKTFL